MGVETLTSATCMEDSSVPVVRPKVMLVLDRSGSMTDQVWDHDLDAGSPDVTRWFSLHGVVSNLLAEHGARLDLGATMFPAEGAAKDTWAQACVAPTGPDVAVGPNAAGEIISALPGADALLEGATPASAAYLTALDHLGELEGDDPLVMVLVTDGVANCGDGADVEARYDEELRDAVAAAYEQMGIVTYVVGIDISHQFDDGAQIVPHDAMQEVALAGGVPREGDAAYFDVQNESALQAALDEIAGDLGCTLNLEESTDPDRDVIFSVDGDPRFEVSDCDGEDGWRWTDAKVRDQIQLCGQTCTDYQATGSARLDYDCSL